MAGDDVVVEEQPRIDSRELVAEAKNANAACIRDDLRSIITIS